VLHEGVFFSSECPLLPTALLCAQTIIYLCNILTYHSSVLLYLSRNVSERIANDIVEEDVAVEANKSLTLFSVCDQVLFDDRFFGLFDKWAIITIA